MHYFKTGIVGFIFFVIASHTSVAQSELSAGFFYSTPTGNYRSTNLNGGSFAKPGWGFQFQHIVRGPSWPKAVALTLNISYQENELDHTKISERFTAALGNRTTLSPASYKPLLITLGPVFRIPVTERLNVALKTGIGFMFTNIDSFIIKSYNTQGDEILKEVISFKGHPNFSYLLGIGLNYEVSETLGIGVFSQFSAGREKVETSIGAVAMTESTFDLSFINTGIKISFKI